MWWILVWALLVVGAVLVIGLLVWRLVKQLLALGRTIGESAGKAGDAFAPSGVHATDAPPSVFLDPEAPGGPDAPPVTRQTLRSGRRRA